MTRLECNHYNFDFDSYYRDINLYFILDKENNEFIGSDSNNHLLANDKFQRYGKPVSIAKSFFIYYYTVWRPVNTTAIVNQDVWAVLEQKKEAKLILYYDFKIALL